MPLVDIPDVGTVDFPDEMSQDDITTAIKDSIVPGVKAGKWKSFLEPQATTVKTTPVSTGVLPMEKPTVFEPPSGIITPTIPEQQPPENWGTPVEIGKGEATIPRFGKEGTITRGVSDIASGLGEFALNRPEELALSIYPPTSLVMASKYLPGIVSQTVQDIADTVYGDKEAAGRVLGTAATLAIPGAAKEARAQYLTKGPSAVPVVPPEIQAISQSGIRDTAGQIVPPEGVVPEPSTLVNLPEALQPATLMPKSFQMVTAPDRGERRAILKARAPVVPETPPEAERALTVIQEIRQRGLTTKEQIRKAFPQLSRQEAAVLRDQAFPREKVPDNLSKADVNRLFLDRLNEESEAQLKAETERIPSASEISPPTEVHGDVRPQPVEGLRQVPVKKGGEGIQPQTERGLSKEEAQAPVAPQVEPAPTAEPTPTPKVEPAAEQIKVGDIVEAKSHQITGLIHRGKVVSVKGDEIGMVNEENVPVLVLKKNVQKVEPAAAPTPTLTEGGAPEAGKTSAPTQAAEKVEKEAEMEKGWRVKVRYLDNPAGPSRGTEEMWTSDKPIKGQSGIGAFGRYIVQSVSRERPERTSPKVTKPTTPTPPSAEPSVGLGATSPDPAASFSSSVKDVPVKSKVAANLTEKTAEKQNLGITSLPPIGDTGLAKVGNAIKAGLRELRDIPKFTAFKETVNRWFGQNQQTSLEVRALQKDIESRVPTEARREVITNYLQADGDTALLDTWAKGTKNSKRKAAYEAAKNLTPDELKISQAVRKLYDDYLTKAQAYDLVDTGIEDYVTQIWKRPLLGGAQFAQFASKLSPQFRFGKQRVFENFFEGEQAGFKPVTKDISKLVGLYVSEMGKTIATRDFIKDLTTKDAADGRPLAAPSGVGNAVLDKNATPSIFVRPNAKNKTLRDYSRWTHPALTGWKWVAEDPISGAPVLLKGNLVLHPDIAGHVENILSRSAIKRWYDTPSTPMGVLPKALAKGLDQWQGVTKQIMLGFFAPFHHVQEATHALGHRVNPVFDLPALNHTDPNLQRAMNHGLALAGDNAAMESFREGVGAGKIFGKIPIVGEWANQWSDFLFHEYIPRLKWKTYQEILKRNLERYQAEIGRGDATIDDVEYLSSKQTNAAFGHQNYADLGRNPTIQHIARTLALAPDFLEARTRFFGQALKGAIGKEGREQLMAMATLAGTFWVGSRIINKLGSGDYHNEEPFGVVLGGRTYTMRSVPEDAWRAFKDSRKFIYGRVSPIIGRGTIELLTGKNYRGEKTTALETMQDLLASWVPITLRNLPGVERLSPSQVNRSVNAWESFLGAMGVQISRHSPISKGYQLGGEYMKAQGVKEDRGSYPVSKYQQLRYALEDSDLEKAALEIRRLRESEKMTSSKLQKGFHESLFHPWTKSEAMDRQFKHSLTPENKMLVNEAEEQRRRVWQRFVKARGMSFIPQP